VSVQKAELLQSWQLRCDAAQAGHYYSAAEFQRWHFRLGVPVVVLSAVVGSSVLATANETESSLGLKLCVGILSLVAAALSASQMFLRYGERSERHRQAGVAYSALKREIEEIMTYPDTDLDECISDIRKRWDALNADCPTIPLAYYPKVVSSAGVAPAASTFAKSRSI
jgi:hypothetical protein